MHMCRVMCRILPFYAALRRTVQHFAAMVPFDAVLCRAEKAPKSYPDCTRLSGGHAAVMCQNRVCSGACWRCDCVACLGSLGASAVAQHDARLAGVEAGSRWSRGGQQVVSRRAAAGAEAGSCTRGASGF